MNLKAFVETKYSRIIFRTRFLNFPLHSFSGQTEIVNMLLTKSKGINIDAKNNLGFTPLMKAALQGRTKSAKLLLFAGKYSNVLLVDIFRLHSCLAVNVKYFCSKSFYFQLY